QFQCMTCHNPHEPVGPPDRVRYYRNKCLSCHEQEHRCSETRAKRLARSKEDSCIDCHMTRFPSKDIVHTAATDHRIPLRPAASAPGGPLFLPTDLSKLPLVPFHGNGKFDPNDHEASRDLDLALLKLLSKNEAVGPQHFPLIRQRLERAAVKFPSDVPTLRGLAECLLAKGEHVQGLGILEKILAQTPDDTQVLSLASYAYLERDRPNKSLDYCRRALALSPGDPQLHCIRAVAWARKQNWPEALQASRAALRCDPGLPHAHFLLGYCCTQLGDAEQAARAYAVVEALQSSETDRLRQLLEDFAQREPSRER